MPSAFAEVSQVVTCCVVVTLTAHITNFIVHVWHSMFPFQNNDTSLTAEGYHNSNKAGVLLAKGWLLHLLLIKIQCFVTIYAFFKLKATEANRLVKCHNAACRRGNFFHLVCLGLRRMPNNAKTTWVCWSWKRKKSKTNNQPTTSLESSDQDYDSESIDDVIITKVTTSTVDKFGSPAKVNDEDYSIISYPKGWLSCHIIQAAHVRLQEANPLLEGLQRPTVGQVRNFDFVSSDFVQINHTGSDHWVCISPLGCMPGMVNVYDS